ncbi:MAG: hypothetical protein IJ814_02280 [Paludibacteraceae bacterium]|nr:hypothetical protein [Paludibacteraceae bacterium]
MIKRIVILGGHIQALGLARQAAAKELEVVLLSESRYSVARYSRAVKRTIIFNSEEEEIQYINDLCLPNQATLLFPTNDEAVDLLCNHYVDFNTRFALGIPKPDIVALFNNKRKAYQYAEANNIPCPKCWYPNTMRDVEQLAEILPYPVVVKPAVMYSFHTTFGKKAFRCNNPEELLSIYKLIDGKQYPLNAILIQEFLSGGPKHLYSCGVMSVDGKPIVSLQANRIRQNPMDFGNSTTFAVTCNIQEIQEQTERLLQLTHYFGLGEIEWMYDEKVRQYKFLEINTRAWKWHTICNQLGFSFIGAMIDYFNGIETPVDVPMKKVGWVERLTDWTVIAKEMIHGRMSLRDACASYRIKHESAVWSWSDPLPGIMYVLMSPILYVKRY